MFGALVSYDLFFPTADVVVAGGLNVGLYARKVVGGGVVGVGVGTVVIVSSCMRTPEVVL